MRRRISSSPFAVCLLALALFALPAAAQALDTKQAASFLANLQEQAASRLGDASVSDNEKEEHFRKLFNENFDVPAIGRFVIGRYWRGASQADQNAFLTVFEDAMVQRFLPLLAENSSERFQIGHVTPDARNKDMALIDSRIDRAEGEPYKVSWRVRERNGDFKILDIVAEGVSMAITQRSEFESILQRQGIDGLLSMLKDKVQKLSQAS